MKYLLCRPKGGFNDILNQIKKCLHYCIHFNRILLIDTINSYYKINFSHYFKINSRIIISDIKQIKKILSNKNLSIYPHILKNNVVNFKTHRVNSKNKGFFYKDVKIVFNFNVDYKENVIVSVRWGGGNSIKLFKKIEFKNHLKHIINKKYSKIKKPYLCIYVRNTDLKCDYKRLYRKYKKIIKSFRSVYIATDDKKCFKFFKSKRNNVLNFTTFPKKKYKNLHENNTIHPSIKFIDMLCDLVIIARSKKLITNSKGGFIHLCKILHNKKKIIKNKLV